MEPWTLNTENEFKTCSVVDYIESFPLSTALHGNSEKSSGHYVRTAPRVQDSMDELIKDKNIIRCVPRDGTQ